jgi:hypothetical protein
VNDHSIDRHNTVDRLSNPFESELYGSCRLSTQSLGSHCWQRLLAGPDKKNALNEMFESILNIEHISPTWNGMIWSYNGIPDSDEPIKRPALPQADATRVQTNVVKTLEARVRAGEANPTELREESGVLSSMTDQLTGMTSEFRTLYRGWVR